MRFSVRSVKHGAPMLFDALLQVPQVKGAMQGRPQEKGKEEILSKIEISVYTAKTRPLITV